METTNFLFLDLILPHSLRSALPESIQAIPPCLSDCFYFQDDCKPKIEDPEIIHKQAAQKLGRTNRISTRNYIHNWKSYFLRLNSIGKLYICLWNTV